MNGTFSRLRWQLTLSHLAAIACTLVSMIAAVVLLGSSLLSSASAAASSREPLQDAHSVARAISGVVASGTDAADIGAILRALASGELQAVFGFGGRPDAWGMGLHDIAYVVVLGPDLQELASSDPSGPAFSPPERALWQQAIDSGRVVTPDHGNAVALAAAPITDDSGRTLGTTIVGKSALSTNGLAAGFDVLRGLAIFGAASVVVLLAASLFAIVSSSLVAYLLSRRLVRRLERLGRAAEALAGGDLNQRVESGSQDEVGQLAQRFNSMAADLERSLTQLRAERDRVSGLLEQRRQLVASASHELRTPVATVRGYVESALGRSSELPEDLQADLQTIEREITRLQQLIEDLFAIAQTELGRLTLRIEPTDVGLVLRGLVDTVAPLAWRQRRVSVLFEPDGEVPRAMADAARLEQVVSNLLSNAVRHTAPGGLVAASVSTEGDEVLVAVRDTGEGIAAEDLPHVFERFYRGRNNGEPGAGLGLALVAELTTAMGGTVAAHSREGEGSCFELRLPKA